VREVFVNLDTGESYEAEDCCFVDLEGAVLFFCRVANVYYFCTGSGSGVDF